MIKKSFVITAFLLILVLFGNIGLYLVYPDVSKLKKWRPKKTAFMEYQEKEWLKQGKKKKIKYKWAPLSKISPYLIKAVIIAEDDKFWSHEGFDFEAMQKAIEKDIKKKRFKAGGSTISQQLAKNLYLSPAKNPVRKLKEAILTWRIERTLSKKRIIELYLNVAEWGDGLFGIETAARHYLGKGAASLTALEAAELASVLPNPRRYKPTGLSGYVRSRSARIYKIMVKRGIVIPEYEEVMDELDKEAVEDQEDLNEQQESGSQEDVGGISNAVDRGRMGGQADNPQTAPDETHVTIP
ncbi:MAG: monofunctional biosynthetic peptidoglycan transglycosylase [Syntrophales bacterium]|nr:monofunctional biosynthetic peptidoglycan transglycosylase [Syntrophales bacterium]